MTQTNITHPFFVDEELEFDDDVEFERARRPFILAACCGARTGGR